MREAKRAFKKFYSQCFWSYSPKIQITKNDIAWVAVAKDPGFNPRSLLELLKRRGKFRSEPKPNYKRGKDYELHFGQPGGVLPVIKD